MGNDTAPAPVSVPTPGLMTQPVGGLPTIPIVAPMPVVEKPSTGRFMDVVHPSSNMRNTLVMPERTPNQMVVKPVVQPPAIQSPITPIPMKSTPPEIKMPDFDKDEDADIDRISNDITNTLSQSSNEPLDTPFLSGTKVEKRPLGAFSTEPTPPPVMNPMMNPPFQSSFQADRNNTNQNMKSSEINTPLPAELQSDLLSIESDTVQPEKANVMNTPAPINTSQPTVATSIPQQYQEQPSSGDKNNGAIYDTNAYHKAMISPVKKKSGWTWVIWIVILLVVSAGAGAAVYFFVLPRL